MEKKNKKTGIVSEQKDYKVELKYSKEAKEKKLVKFTTKNGDSFEISAEELIHLLTTQVNMETLAPTFVETTRVNVVSVKRQLEATLGQDMKKGEKIRIDYFHPYPLEFAIIEEAYKIAEIKNDSKFIALSKEFIEKVKAKLKPSQEEFVKTFYKGHKNIDLENTSLRSSLFTGRPHILLKYGGINNSSPSGA